MNKCSFILITVLNLLSLSCLQAANFVQVRTIGSSPKGQYVAFEEYGHNQKSKAFSRIRVKNMWKNKYVDTPIQIKAKNESEKLSQVRIDTKKRSLTKLKKFNISH